MLTLFADQSFQVLQLLDSRKDLSPPLIHPLSFLSDGLLLGGLDGQRSGGRHAWEKEAFVLVNGFTFRWFVLSSKVLLTI